MMKEKNCRTVGGTSAIFGLLLVIVSGVFINYLVNRKCSNSDSEYINKYRGSFNDNDKPGSHYRPKRSADYGGYSYDDNDSCNIPTLTFCGGFGITVGLIQLIFSGLLCSVKKQNARLYSIIWILGHVFVCLSLIVIFSVDLSYNTKYYNQYDRTKEVIFLVMVVIDFAILLPFIVCVIFLLMKKSDYYDYSTNDSTPQDHPIVFRAQ